MGKGKVLIIDYRKSLHIMPVNNTSHLKGKRKTTEGKDFQKMGQGGGRGCGLCGDKSVT